MQTTTSRLTSGTETANRRGIAQAPWKPSVVQVGDRISGTCVTMGSKREGKVLTICGPLREDCGGYRYEIATDDGRKAIVFGEFIIDEPGNELANMQTAEVRHQLDCQRALLARKRPNRIRTRRERQAVIALRDRLEAELAGRAPAVQITANQLRKGDIIERPDTRWHVTNVEPGAVLVFVTVNDGEKYTYQPTEAVHIQPRPTEMVEASGLRDGDVIVNSASGEEIPVLLATPYGSLIMIWTATTNGFAMSPSLLVEIKRRNGSATAPVGFPHFSGGFCDDRHCAGSSAATYDGHWVWKTAEAYARDHHANGEVCPNLDGCSQPDCHKAVREPSVYEDPAVLDAIFGTSRKAGA